MTDLTKHFGGIVANDNVSVTLEPGDRLGIIGANGSGKSTLLNVIAGLHKPTSGTVHFRGIRISGRRPDQVCRLGISRTWQNFRLFLDMSVLDNVLIGASMSTRELGDIEDKVRNIVQRVGLAPKLHDRASTLSTGQRKRLELARCLSTDPDVILLDEPVAGVDPGNRGAVIDLLEEISLDTSLTTMLVEHDPVVIRRLCTRAIGMVSGRVVAQGSPNEVYDVDEIRTSYLEPRND